MFWLFTLQAAVAAVATAPTTVPELAALADEVVQGKVVATRPVWDGPRIYTEVRVLQASGEIGAFSVPGGCLDGLCQTVYGAPRVALGQEVLAFVSDGRVMALSEGVFFIEGERAIHKVEGIEYLSGEKPVAEMPVQDLLDVIETNQKKR